MHWNRLVDLKTIARELSHKYHITDSTSGDLQIDAARDRLTRLRHACKDLLALASTYASRMEAATTAAQEFATALRTSAPELAASVQPLPADEQRRSADGVRPGLPSDAGTSRDQSSGSIAAPKVTHETSASSSSLLTSEFRSDAFSASQTEALLHVLLQTAQAVETVAADQALQGLLSSYRSFLSEVCEVVCSPMLRTDIPAVDKARKSMVHAEAAAERSTVSPPAIEHQHSAQGYTQHDKGTVEMPASATSPTLHRSATAPKPSKHEHSTVHRSVSLRSHSMHSQPATNADPDIERTKAFAEEARAKYHALRDAVVEKADQVIAEQRERQMIEAERLTSGVKDVFDQMLATAQHQSSAVSTAVAKARESFDATEQQTSADSAGLAAFVETPPTTPSPSAYVSDASLSGTCGGSASALDKPSRTDSSNSSDPSVSNSSLLGLTPCPLPVNVDLFQLADEMGMLVRLKFEDDVIHRMYQSCTDVKPTFLPVLRIRYMTLCARTDAIADTPPLHNREDSHVSNAVQREGQLAEPQLMGSQTNTLPDGTRKLTCANPTASHAHVDVSDTSGTGGTVQYLAVKGTNFKSLKHIMLDMNASHVFDDRLGVHFHRGFYDAGVELYQEVHDKLQKHIPVRVLGHSLGAAAGCICALLLEKDGFNIEYIHMFGSPKITDEEGACRLAAQLGDRALRITHYNDIVRMSPPARRRQKFRHFGRLFLLHEDDTTWYLPQSPPVEPAMTLSHSKGFASHATTFYWTCLQKQLVRVTSVDYVHDPHDTRGAILDGETDTGERAIPGNPHKAEPSVYGYS